MTYMYINCTMNSIEDGSVDWDNDTITMISPSPNQCQIVLCDLMKTKVPHRIELVDTSQDSLCFLLLQLHKVRVVGLSIQNTSSSSAACTCTPECIHCISNYIISPTNQLEELSFNQFHLTSSGMKEITKSLASTKNIKKLQFSKDEKIMKKDVEHIADLLKSNETLQELGLLCCNINDNGIQVLSRSLKTNKTLTRLHISFNSEITSTGAKSLSEMLPSNFHLRDLDLRGTSVKEDGVESLLQLYMTDPVRSLFIYLDGHHKEVCEKIDGYEKFKDRLFFSTRYA